MALLDIQIFPKDKVYIQIFPEDKVCLGFNAQEVDGNNSIRGKTRISL